MAAVASVYPLGDLMAAILARLVSRGEAVAQESAVEGDVDTPWWCKGIDWIAGNHAPPRYVWFPTRINAAPPHKGDLANQERAIVSGLELVEVHCWGVDIGQAWSLRRNLFRAMQANMGTPAYEDQGTQIVANGGSLGTAGVVMIVTLGFFIPVTDDSDEVVTPIAVNITSKLVKNGVETLDTQFTVE